MLFLGIISFISVFLIASIYIGSQVFIASRNGTLPLDSEILKKNMFDVVDTPLFFNSAVSGFSILYYFCRRKKRTIAPFNKQPLSFYRYIRTVIFFAAFAFVIRIIVGLIVFLLSNNFTYDLDLESSTSLEFYNFLVCCFIVPVSEELIFRKILISDLSMIYTQRKCAIIAIACFVLMHNGTNALFALFLGTAIVYIYFKYNNLKLCIISHMAANIIGYMDGRLIPFNDDILLIVLFFCMGIVAYYIFTEIKNNSKKQ